MANPRDRVLKYVKRVLKTKDRMPTAAEVAASLSRAPRLSPAAKGKLVEDYAKSSTTIERIARLDMKHGPRARRQGRAI
jgi:hypothetical protein